MTKEETERKADENPVKVHNACTELAQNSDSNKVIILQMAPPVLITDQNTVTLKTCAFCENGSAGCFLTQSLRPRLAVPVTKKALQLGTIHVHTLLT